MNNQTTSGWTGFRNSRRVILQLTATLLLIVTTSIGAFAIAPSNLQVLYVGTGEADIRSDITYGDGVYKSTDGGSHWKHIGLRETRHIGKVLIDPHNPDVVLVAALGHAYGPNEQRGVFRTSDGGQTWLKVLYKNRMSAL